MTLEQKCKLYFMVYQKLSTVIFARGGARNGILPMTIHAEALKRTNYILAAIGEKLEMDELFSTPDTNNVRGTLFRYLIESIQKPIKGVV